MRACEDVCVCLEWHRGFPQSESGKVGSEIFFPRLGEKLGSFASCPGYPVFKTVEQSFDFFALLSYIHHVCLV